MITYICGSMIKYKQFPEEFLKELDVLMEDGDEILLGDSDFDHRVYGRFRNKQYENVSVLRERFSRRCVYVPQIESALPSYTKMAEKCDRLTAVWDGESPEAFVNMLLVLAMQKKCKMYYLPTGECALIESVEDLSRFVPEREGWTAKDIEEVLRTCGFEDQMVSYLLENYDLRETFITGIVCRAPVPLKKKLDIFESLMKKNNLNYEALKNISGLMVTGTSCEAVKQVLKDTFGMFGYYLCRCISMIHCAEHALEYGKYYLFAEWYDTEDLMEKSSPAGLFDSVKDAMKYIRLETELEEEESAEDESANAQYYRLEVWSDDIGSWGSGYVHTYDFYIYKGEICWFRELSEDRQKNGLVYYMPKDDEFFSGRRDLSLETPFNPGDIVLVDCRPFGPAFHAIVTEAHDQFDCCMPQVFYCVPGTDKWTVNALKHKIFYKSIETACYIPPLSPLYRLRSVKADELSEEDELLLEVSAHLEGSEEKARLFWKAWHETGRDEMTEKEVRKLIGG